MSEQFRGSYGVTITPFTEDGSKIDLPAWRRFIDWQIDEGSPGSMRTSRTTAVRSALLALLRAS